MRRPWKLLPMLIAGAVFPFGQDARGAEKSPQEVSVCGFLGLEAAMFGAWRNIAAMGPSAPESTGFAYQGIQVETSDKRRLKGYRISATGRAAATRAILVLQGNAMLADQLRDTLTYFADRGFDVFIFDYRGYGESDGAALLKPISLDQALIAKTVHGKGYDRIFLYGISIGGVFSLSPNMPIALFRAVVVDSSPAKLPWYGFCPSQYDPVANVPSDASNILVISGGRDRVVRASEVAPLGKTVEARGGAYRHEPNFDHPLMDAETVKRFRIVADFFMARD